MLVVELVVVELVVVELVELVLVELVLVVVELAVVELVELVLVVVELVVSSSTSATAVSDSFPFTLPLLTCSTAIALFATVCSLIVICSLSVT